jgi:hypothetical protein
MIVFYSPIICSSMELPHTNHLLGIKPQYVVHHKLGWVGYAFWRHIHNCAISRITKFMSVYTVTFDEIKNVWGVIPFRVLYYHTIRALSLYQLHWLRDPLAPRVGGHRSPEYESFRHLSVLMSDLGKCNVLLAPCHGFANCEPNFARSTRAYPQYAGQANSLAYRHPVC